jgi:hypothetical protein
MLTWKKQMLKNFYNQNPSNALVVMIKITLN